MKTATWVFGCAVAVLACSTAEIGSQNDPIATSTLDALRAEYKFAARTATDGTNAVLPSRSVIPDADAPALVSSTLTGWTPSGASMEAAVSIPETASGPTTIGTPDGKMRIGTVLRGANASVHAALSGGNAVFSSADARGGHYVETVLHDGLESFVSLNQAPGGDLIFDVTMTGVEGLRVVDDTIEFLDAGGAPRLRMASPVVVDSKGQVAAAHVALPTCAFDDSPAPPWGRKVIAPGAKTCEVHISWSDAGLTYPALLDPTWTTTGSMVTARRWHGATLLSTLKVLVIGGEGVSSPYLGVCELYDPGTGTWAATGRLRIARRRFATATISGGKVLAAGGDSSAGPTASAELYDPSTGLWSPAGSMASARAYLEAARLGTGQVLLAGGVDAAGNVLASSELFDPSSGTFTSTGSLLSGRQSFTLSVLSSGKVLAAGGVDASSNVLASAELYDPSAGTWTATGALTTARQRHKAVVLDDGRALFTGGYTNAAATTTTAAAEVYDDTLGQFFDQDVVGPSRADHAAVALPDNHALIFGGQADAAHMAADTEDFGANNATTTRGSNLRVPVSQATATMMGTGYVLLAGGNDNGRILNTVQRTGPFFYVYGGNGAAHPIQITTLSGSFDAGFSLGLTYDTTPLSVTYDWLGTSLRASVSTGGTSLGTIVVAQKGDATFTSADGSQQVTENRNLVTAGDIAFMDEKAVIVGPERTFGLLTKYLTEPVHLPPWFNEWFFTVRGSLAQMSGQAQGDLWQAITDITFDTSQTTCSGKPCRYHVRAEIGLLGGPDDSPEGGNIQPQDCTPTSCSVDMAWFDVDVVRAHYQVDHESYPQFFQNHRYYLDQMESWIKNPGGWQDTHGIYGVLPYGHLPYWDASSPLPNNGNSPGNNFVYAQLSGGGVPWGQGRNCATGATYNKLHGDGSHARVDTFLNPTPPLSHDPPGGCDWESLQFFPDPGYTLSYSTTILCTANNSSFFWGTGGQPCTSDPTQGFHTWHGCVHSGLAGGSVVFFGAFDSPGYPAFFPWHAWVDHFYQLRLDCYGSGP